MPNPFQKIAIIGAGAVGGYYGARLAQHGNDVHFLLRSDYDAIRQHGLSIQSRDGDFTLAPQQLHLYNRPDDMPAVDLVLVTLKTTSNDQYQSLIEPLLKPNTAILTLQNGLGNEDRLAELFGDQRILGGLAFTCINRVAPGKIHHMDHGLIRIGEFTTGISDRAKTIGNLFNQSNIHCDLLDDLRYGRWEKLVWNVPFNGLGALMDLTADRLIANDAGVTVVRQLMTEVIETASALGVRLPVSLIQQKIEETRTMGQYHTSMQIDRHLGRPLEIEAILGNPLRVANKHQVLTPFLHVLYQLVAVLQK